MNKKRWRFAIIGIFLVILIVPFLSAAVTIWGYHEDNPAALRSNVCACNAACTLTNFFKQNYGSVGSYYIKAQSVCSGGATLTRGPKFAFDVYCGDAVCGTGENQANCPEDCGLPPAVTHSCEMSEDIILSLTSSKDALAGVWNSGHGYEICYNEIFGQPYLGVPHACDGNNKVVGLSGNNNALAQDPSLGSYPIDVCYGDLNCRAIAHTPIYSKSAADANLIAYYSFNIDARDDSGRGHTGVPVGGPASVAGRFGNAYNFDGNEYIRVADHPELRFASGVFSISAWVYTNSFWDPSDQSAILEQGWDANTGYALTAWVKKPLFYAGHPTWAWRRVSSPNEISKGVWHHIVGVKKGNLMKMYVDNVHKATIETSGYQQGAGDLTIGFMNWVGGSAYWTGAIDEVKLFNKALTPEEIYEEFSRNGVEITGYTSGGTCNGAYEKKILTLDAQSSANSGDASISNMVDICCETQEGPDLVAYYNFNSDTLDYSGYRNHGAVQGGGLGVVEGINETNAYYFDGTDDYILIADADSLDIKDKMTFASWVKFDELPSTATANFPIFSKHDEYLIRAETSDGFHFFIYDQDTPDWEPRAGTGPIIEEDEWYHVVGVLDYDGTTNKIKKSIYINGEPVASEETQDGPIASSANPFTIGKFYGEFFKGTIDEVKIWKTALTPQEIVDEYNESPPPMPKEGVFWSDMNGNPITNAQINDTLILGVNVTGSEGVMITYNVYKDDGTLVGTITTDGIATWKLEEEGNYYFIADINGDLYDSRDYITGTFSVTGYDNDQPQVVITGPTDGSTFVLDPNTGETGLIDFTVDIDDSDDDVSVLWEFGDGTSVLLGNCSTGGNCDTTHSYNTTGTKRVKVTVTEEERGQVSVNYSEIYVYREGMNIFSKISSPKHGEVINMGNYQIDGSTSIVTNCSSDQVRCNTGAAGHGAGACVLVADGSGANNLYCYDYADSGASGFVFTWYFDGEEDTEHKDNQGFDRLFDTPGTHLVDLNVAYTY